MFESRWHSGRQNEKIFNWLAILEENIVDTTYKNLVLRSADLQATQQ